MKQTAIAALRHLTICLAMLLSAVNGFSDSIPMPDSMELAYVVPDGWSHQRTDGEVRISAPGTRLSMTVVPLQDSSKFNTQASIDDLATRVTQPYAIGSVEKKTTLIPIKGCLGSYAAFTDASLVGKSERPGSFKNATSGVVRYGNYLVSFTLLSNDRDSELYKAALSVVTSLDYHPTTPDLTTVVAPGKHWGLAFKSPPFVSSSSGLTEGGYVYKASSEDGFNLSVFIENRQNEDHGHKACADHYWPSAKQNPMIDPSTVVTKQRKNCVSVSYRIRGEQDNFTFDIPNINLYFEYNDKWVDIHISKFPFKSTDQVLLDNFVDSLTYSMTKTKGASLAQ